MKENFDRFIPNRSAMDFGYAHYMLTTNKGIKGKENFTATSEAYIKKPSQAADLPTRILAFRNKSSNPKNTLSISPKSKTKPPRYIPQKPECTVTIPDILEDFCLNLLDWSSSNVLSVALQNEVYLLNGSDGTPSAVLTFEVGLPTSVSWAPDGRKLAVGLYDSHVQLWDISANKEIRTLEGIHRGIVSSLAWNGHILTTGGYDGKIVNNDVRVRSHVVDTYRGHRQEVCGLKWSLDGKQLASGGNDNAVNIWDKRSAVSSNSQSTRWLHKFDEHTAAVKALAWCPFQSNLLASGGGKDDQCIKLWDTHTGARLNSVDTGSEISALLWNKNERELLSSHGSVQNQLTLWKYASISSMLKMATLDAHISNVLYMSQSPDGYTVASAGADEKLKLWKIFGNPPAPPKSFNMPFANFNSIR